MDKDLVPWISLIQKTAMTRMLTQDNRSTIVDTCENLNRRLHLVAPPRSSRHINRLFLQELTTRAVDFAFDEQVPGTSFVAHGGYHSSNRRHTRTDVLSFVGWRHAGTTLLVFVASREPATKPLQIRDLILHEFHYTHKAAVLIPALRLPEPAESNTPLIKEMMHALREDPTDVTTWSVFHDLVEEQEKPVAGLQLTLFGADGLTTYRKEVTFGLSDIACGLYAARCLDYQPLNWSI